jgi:hypothetical protein
MTRVWFVPWVLVGIVGTLGWSGEVVPEATHRAGPTIVLADILKSARISAVCLDAAGNLLVCDSAGKAVLTLGPDGKLLAQWPLPLPPQAICAHDANTTYVGGEDRVVRLDKEGKVAKMSQLPSGENRIGAIPAIATTDKDVFVVASVGFSFSVFRLGHDLGSPQEIVRRLRGCCGQMSIAAKDGVLYAAENARHRIVRFNRDGKELGAWGRADRVAIEAFGGCCNPMNICLGRDGNMYTSESSLGRVKRYTPEGKFLDLVGLTAAGGGCLNVAVAASADGRRVFVLDSETNRICVLVKK